MTNSLGFSNPMARSFSAQPAPHHNCPAAGMGGSAGTAGNVGTAGTAQSSALNSSPATLPPYTQDPASSYMPGPNHPPLPESKPGGMGIEMQMMMAMMDVMTSLLDMMGSLFGAGPSDKQGGHHSRDFGGPPFGHPPIGRHGGHDFDMPFEFGFGSGPEFSPFDIINLGLDGPGSLNDLGSPEGISSLSGLGGLFGFGGGIEDLLGGFGDILPPFPEPPPGLFSVQGSKGNEKPVETPKK